jgi:hypothetical protein
MAKLLEVTSYSHPPAKEQVKPDVLAERIRAFVKVELVSANISSVLSVFKNDKTGIEAFVEIGTPSVNTAVTLVASTTVTVSA